MAQNSGIFERSIIIITLRCGKLVSRKTLVHPVWFDGAFSIAASVVLIVCRVVTTIKELGHQTLEYKHCHDLVYHFGRKAYIFEARRAMILNWRT